MADDEKPNPSEVREALEKLSRELADRGQLIEAGWVALRASVISPDAREDQLREMRLSFFAGAQHLFGSIMSLLEEGAEPTEADLKRMELINDELNKFVFEMKKRARQT